MLPYGLFHLQRPRIYYWWLRKQKWWLPINSRGIHQSERYWAGLRLVRSINGLLIQLLAIGIHLFLWILVVQEMIFTIVIIGKAYSLWTIVNKHFSDRRLKENIVECKHKALWLYPAIPVHEYDWKKQEDRPRRQHTKIGLIAQEVQAQILLVLRERTRWILDNLRLTNIALQLFRARSEKNQKLTYRLRT